MTSPKGLVQTGGGRDRGNFISVLLSTETKSSFGGVSCFSIAMLGLEDV
jgi:hypothetical protein